MLTLDISFEGYWQCRLATDPDPSDEQRGISGFTYSVAGETLLEPSFWSQAKDIEKIYGQKEEAFKDELTANPVFNIKNIREASPDYGNYNQKGIGIKVVSVTLEGQPCEDIEAKLMGGLVRFEPRPEQPDWKWKGPIFEGRNQITSDGDPDRFTLSPFVFSIATANDEPVLKRFDPLDFNDPGKLLWQIHPGDPGFDAILKRRLPKQRFALSNELLSQIGIDPDNIGNYFVNRADWLQGKILEAQASGKTALAEAYKSRYFAVNFFTQSTGPTVLSNRLLSRVPLRQLYRHSIRGTREMKPAPLLNAAYFAPYKVDMEKEWEIMYYLGAFDGDLLSGWCTGTLSLPVSLP